MPNQVIYVSCEYFNETCVFATFLKNSLLYIVVELHIVVGVTI